MQKKQILIDSLKGEIFDDFESIYESMQNFNRLSRPKLSNTSINALNQLQDYDNNKMRQVEIETESLNRSLIEVEDTYRRAILTQSPSELQESILSYRTSPMPSLNSDITRPDSRNTNQSFLNSGPALVEEMTLSDLEDEISYAIMSKSNNSNDPSRLRFADGEQMLRAMRSRMPIPLSISQAYSERTFQNTL